MNIDIGQNAEGLRKRSGFSQLLISELLGIDNSTLSKIAIGENPISKYADALSILYGCEVSDLEEGKHRNTKTIINIENKKKDRLTKEDLEAIYEVKKIAYKDGIQPTCLSSTTQKKKDRYDLAKEASELRLSLGLDAHSPIDIFKIIDGIKNITTVKVFPMGNLINSISIKNGENITVAVNSNMNKENQGFYLVHQLYHMLIDNNADTYICCNGFGFEKEVNDFVSLFFTSPAALSVEIKKNNGKADIASLSKLFGISQEAISERLAFEK